MFCSNCGTQLPEGVNFCNVCGKAQQTMNAGQMQGIPSSASNNVPPYSNNATGSTIAQNGYIGNTGVSGDLLFSDKCCWIYSPIVSFWGRAELTTEMFHYKHTVPSIVGPISQAPKEFSIPISDIANVRTGKAGFLDTLIITMTSGREFNMFFTEKSKVIQCFRNVLSGGPS